MIFQNLEVHLERGTFKVPLNYSCKGKVSLVDIILPCINTKDKPNNSIQISCDQIDATFENPDRLLKRIYFDKLAVTNHCHFWEAKILDFKDLNSSDNFLHFKIERLNGHPIKFHRNVGDHRVFITLAYENFENEHEKWTCV